MKTILLSLVLGAASFAFAEGDRPLCEPGSTAVFGGKTYVCSYTGMGWEDPTRAPIRCQEGRVAWLPVYGKYQGEGAEVTARAVCRSGKYIFDNDEYNYRPTRGMRCQEGRTAFFPVRGVYQGENEINARATCVNGRYIFDNPAYRN